MGEIVDVLVFVEVWEILDLAGERGGKRLPTLTCNKCWPPPLYKGDVVVVVDDDEAAVGEPLLKFTNCKLLLSLYWFGVLTLILQISARV